jgi:hypothetical protein
MKNIIFLFLVLTTFFAVDGLSQAKKPTIMVVPSDNWCILNGYFSEINNQGTIAKIPNYKKALQENTELLTVISKINGLMVERGFPLKNMESALKTLESENAENAMLSSKNGSELTESPVDKLKQVAKADIIIQLTWIVNNLGPKKSIRFELQGLDSYTDKQIAQAGGSGAPSFTAEVPILLEEAVLAHLDKFNTDLQTHFDDLFTNGREIIIRIKKFDSWDGDLEKKYGEQELGSIIENWLQQNTIRGRFNTTDATENSMLFEQVRIPLLDDNGRAIDSRGFIKGLKKLLESTPYNIPCKLMTKGLGQAVLVLGGK